ncbi:MAG TPA: carbohydrate-binding protein [Planctomycetota bacterium]|nr:carbohydrate-binding protein [Planctomycetota bacterium]
MLRITLACAFLFVAVHAADIPADYKGKPWQDKPQTIPGKIIAAFYDTGGEGVAYHDVDAKNQGSGTLNKGPEEKNNFRKEEGVDVSYTKAAFDKFADGTKLEVDKYYVGWTAAGEWLNFTVNVETAGTYTVKMLASSNNKDAEISLSVNNADKTNSIVLESTGHWHTWKMYEKIAEIPLEKGPQLLTLKFVKEGNMNVQFLEFELKK